MLNSLSGECFIFTDFGGMYTYIFNITNCNIIQCAENLNISQSYKQLLLNQKPSLPAPNDNYFV